MIDIWYSIGALLLCLPLAGLVVVRAYYRYKRMSEENQLKVRLVTVCLLLAICLVFQLHFHFKMGLG